MSQAAQQLAQQQAQMLATLFRRESPHRLQASTKKPTPMLERGLEVYRANAATLAERTLSSTFPVLAQLIGTTSFEPLARHFWHQYPPQRGDLAQWGASLPVYLANAPQLQGEPYLPDVARVEWALHCAASAADAELDAASFAWLTHADSPVTLALGAGCTLLRSAYPVATLVNAHSSSTPTLDVAAQQLASGAHEVALVWRQGFKPRVRAVGSGEAALIEGLLLRHPLEVALQSASDNAKAFDFNIWLSEAVQTGLVTGAVALANTSLKT